MAILNKLYVSQSSLHATNTKGQVNFCVHMVSVVRMSQVVNFHISIFSLNQVKPSFVGRSLDPFKILSDSAVLLSRWLPISKWHFVNQQFSSIVLYMNGFVKNKLNSEATIWFRVKYITRQMDLYIAKNTSDWLESG